MPWPVAESYVEDCESALGFTFPDSYRISIMDQNGGVVVCDGDTWNLHPIWDKSDKKRLKRTVNDVVRETRAMANWTGWPSDAVCIAANGTGDVLIFSGRSISLDEAVHRWNHETGETEKVAKDFSALPRA
ncbi:SMI1/KNR4 family protein [Tritonibacter scottomollicae]|uniref:SMI1/KNR4 family protein n=1 Tax=Tritonibacter scottomollicae TaxID=483013 RepID=UPI000D083541|nr:SMI1/KNR4 family protein [Tritonibacter scottomollicae]